MKKVFATILFLMALMASPSAALAVDTVPDNLLISLWPEYNNTQVFFMQQIELPATTPLPATVRFAFPTGVQMQWTGEIMGTDVSKDIAATPVVTPKDGYQEVAITLTKSRVAQAEAVWDGLKSDGNNRSITLAWIQRYESKTTTFEFMGPSQSSDVVMVPAPASTRQSPEGFTYHVTAPKVLAVGQTEAFNITYTRPITTPSVTDPNAAATAAGNNTSGAKEPISNQVLLGIFLLAAAGIGTFVYMEKQKNAQNTPTAGKKTPGKNNTQTTPTASKKPLIAVIVVVAILGVFAVYSFSNTSSAPTGNNCEENVTYLQKGVDEYKAAWGVAPTSLGQLLDKKDGKGPFVETVTLKCPSDGTYYTVENGKVIQSESTEPPK